MVPFFGRAFVAILALTCVLSVQAEPPPPPKSDLPKSSSQYITVTSTTPSIVVRPLLDAAQEQPNPKDFYTPELRGAGLEGTAVVDVFVLADGTAGEMRIKQSSGAEALDEAAKAVVERMRWVPGTINGVPSPLWARYAIAFTLESPKPEPENSPSSKP